MRAILTLGLICILAAVTYAKPGTVNTKDGRSIDGDITEQDDQVVIATKVASITLNRSDVATITYAANIKEQYEKKLAALPKNAGARSHLDLAKWLFESKEYALARAEADKALELEPNNADASVLRQTIERTMLWEKTRTSTNAGVVAPKPVGPGVGPAGIGTRPAAAKDRRYLDADQINTIRQMELKEGDPPPRARLDKDVKQRFMQARNLTPKEFNPIPEAVKALTILRDGTPDMKADVKILSDPVTIAAYKKLQPMMLLGCASANCHGSTKAGTFMLYNPGDNEPAAYTNFYVLTQYNPYVAGAVHKMIDRQQPKGSLLLEYGLPRDQAQTPHPDAPGWTPMFRGTADLKYMQIASWIEALIPIEPDYKIRFALPGGAPATQPAFPETQPVEPAPAQPNANPQPGQDPPPAPNPNERPGNSSGGSNETLKDIRSRLRPIRGL